MFLFSTKNKQDKHTEIDNEYSDLKRCIKEAKSQLIKEDLKKIKKII